MTYVASSVKGRVCFGNIMVSRSQCPFKCMHQSQALYVAFHGWNQCFVFGNIEEAPRVFMGVNTEAVCVQIAGEWPYSLE